MKMNLVCFGLFTFLLSSTGCEQGPDLQNPKTYRGTHFSFEYPGNWEIVEETATDDGDILLIQGPNYALLAIQTIPKSDPMDDFVRALSLILESGSDFKSAELTRIEKEVGGMLVNGARERATASPSGIEVAYLRTYLEIEGSEQIAYSLANYAEYDQSASEGFEHIWRTFEIE